MTRGPGGGAAQEATGDPTPWHLGPLQEGPASEGPRVLIGGVGYWWQRDASFGLAVVDALAGMAWPVGVRVAKLDYGAIYVSQDLLAVDPPYDRLILVAGMERGRAPGRLYRSRWDEPLPEPDEIQARVYEAGAGVVDVDHLLIIAKQLGALPREVVLIELEPVDASGGEELSPEALRSLPEVIGILRHEALAPLAGPGALSEMGGA